MYPISDALRTRFENGERKCARITLNNISVEDLIITEADIVSDSLSIDRYCATGDKIEIGSAVSAELSLVLNNNDGKFDDIRFEGSELKVEIGIKDVANSYIPCGYFTVDEPPRAFSKISLKALDFMMRFDNEADLSLLPFPCNAETLVKKIGALCGVNVSANINFNGLPNGTAILYAPTTANLTYRQILQWVAQLTGTCAFIDWNGELMLSWFETTNVNITPAIRYSGDLLENDISITGVVVKTGEGSFVSGTEDYALDVDGNELIYSGTEQNKTDNVFNAVRGFKYRPYECSCIPMPYLYPLDKITYTDKNGNVVSTIITNHTFGLNGVSALAAQGETQQKKGYASQKGITKKDVNKAVAEAMKDVDFTSEKFYVKYSPYSGGKDTNGNIVWSDEVTDDTVYIGTCVTTESTAPTDPTKYNWVRLKGDKGDKGDKGTDGDGIEYKYFISDSSTKPQYIPGDLTWTNEPTGVDEDFMYEYVVQITHHGNGTADSISDVALWSKWGEQGTPGNPATAYSMILSSHVISKNTSGTLSPSTITLNGKSQTGTNSPVDYACRFKIETTTDMSSWSEPYTSSSNIKSYTYTIPSGIKALRCSMYLAGGTTTLLDQQIIPVVSDGTNGGDAYTVVLSNESHTFAGSTSAAIAGSTTCKVMAYKGTSQYAPTIGEITDLPTGMTCSVSNNGTVNATITISVDTTMVTKSGTISIPVTFGGKTFTKYFSYSLALKGATGNSATAYSLISSSNVIAKSTAGALSPSTITFSCKSQTGTSSPTSCTCRLNVAYTTDLSTWTAGYNSDNTSYTYTIPTNAKAVRCQMYTAGGLSNLLDEINIPVVSDGTNGNDAYTVILSNESHTFAGSTSAATASTINVYVEAYKGTTQIASKITKIGSTSVSGTQTVTPYTGLSFTTYNNGGSSTSNYVQISATSSLTTTSGTVTLTIQADGKTFTKDFSFGVARTGATGKGISSVTNYYLATSAASGVTTSTSGWDTNASTQTLTSTNKYLWNYEKINYTDGSTKDTDPCIIGNFAKDGSSIDTITEYYAKSSSNQTAPTSWEIKVPTLDATDKYLWNYEYITYTGGKSATNTDPCVIGVFGADGKTQYWHIKYSDDGGTSFTGSNGEEIGMWIGTCVDFNEADPTSPSAYTWKKFEEVEKLTSVTSSNNTAIERTEEKIDLVASKTYVEKSAFEEYKEEVSSEFSVRAEDINMKFTTTTKQIEDVDGDLQSKFEKVYKHISFNNNGITIGSGDSAIELVIDNTNGIVFKKNGVQFGWWDGTDFHTGNIVVSVTERAQFGDYAFVPRSDGSLSFLKVGGTGAAEGDLSGGSDE